jgi:predicted DNA-binding transcriptional regulator AlpA
MKKPIQGHTQVKKRGFKEDEAGDYIGMSRSFLRQGRMTGKLDGKIPPPPFLKLGNRSIRYLKEDLDAWLAQFRKYEHTHQKEGIRQVESAISQEEEV